MKFFSLLIIVLLYNIIPHERNDYIIIKYVSFDIETPIRVNCDDFFAAFNQEIKTIKITQKEELNRLSHILNELKPDTSRYLPDVRVKVKIFRSGKTETICLDRNSLLLNGKTYILSPKLNKFIEQMIIKYRTK